MIELTERRGECDGPVRGGREERNRRRGSIPVAGRGGRALGRTGCHAKCTECELYNRGLRFGTLSLSARAQTMDRYTAHVVQQWLDRQVYENLQGLSRSCLSALREGYRWQASVLGSSVLWAVANYSVSIMRITG